MKNWEGKEEREVGVCWNAYGYGWGRGGGGGADVDADGQQSWLKVACDEVWGWEAAAHDVV